MTDPRQRHVVIVVLDTARADAFEPYGAPSGASPAIGQLASRGWAAPYAVAPSSWTLPSHVGMLFGASHRKLGLTKETQSRPQLAREVLSRHHDRYLPEVLRRSGYRTVGASTNLWIQEASGFAAGFDEFHGLWRNRQPGLAGEGLRTKLRWVREGLASRQDDGLSSVRDIAAQWARDAARDSRPSMLFLNLVECHSPYLPPRPYNDLGPIQRGRAGLEAGEHLGMMAIWRANAGGPLPPRTALERMRHLYARAIRYMDDWFAEFLELLDGVGILDDTVMVVTSDHGENLGECGRLGHAFSLDDRLVQVPLVVAGATKPTGTALPLTSLPALIADELGVEHPYDVDLATGVAVSEVEGVASPGDPRIADAVRDWGLDESAAHLMTSDATSASDGRLKVIRRGDLERIYDLTADPSEEHPLQDPGSTGTDRSAVDRLRRAIDDAVRTGAVGPADSGAPAATMRSNGDDMDTDQLVAQMKLLGYL